MSGRPIPRLIDHLWYPILVKWPGGTYHHIVEMQGWRVNSWNDWVNRQQQQDTKGHPTGWRI